MNKNVLYYPLIVVFLFLISCSADNNFSNREILFNNNWKFIRNDIKGADKPEFDDSQWRVVNLPHDYSIEDLPQKNGVKQIGPFSEESPGKASTGHVMGGTAWYRKHFTLDKNDKNKTIKLLFDGIYMNSDIWINGNHLGNHPYGYTAFYYDLTPFLKPANEENILAVRVKNIGQNSRWYSGSGIYRNVKLIKTNPLHIKLWGVYITTPKVTGNSALVNAEFRVANENDKTQKFQAEIQLLNQQGDIVWRNNKRKTEKINSASHIILQTKMEVPNPERWSPDNPVLYKLRIELKNRGKLIDCVEQNFGIRSIEFSPEKGFLLNGKSTLLKGGCLHHDNGILGSAAFKTAEYRRVKTMKENGYNAIRTAHNPPSETFLNACDELGMLVLDESFDQWNLAKNENDYHLYFDQWWEKDMESMLLRDRNHPSVIIWSIGNEIKERADSLGLKTARMLKKKVKELDTTRPVTQAICSLWEFKNRSWEEQDEAFSQMDVHGYNYKWQNYRSDHRRFPERIILGTESVAREAYENWKEVKDLPYVIGDFVWTGMDYLGEAGIGHYYYSDEEFQQKPDWPWFISNCGDIDILGNKKPQMYYRDVVWQNSRLELLVHAPLPKGKSEKVSFWGWPNEEKSWNWKGFENQNLQVSVYSNAPVVKLFLNKELVGKQKMNDADKLTATFIVPFQPGKLTAVAFENEKEVARQSLTTTGEPFRLKITSELDTVLFKNDDLAYFNVNVLDENNRLVPNAEVPVRFTIKGECSLQAVGNAKPTNMKSFQKPQVTTFRGTCQLVLRLNKNSRKLKVEATSEGLKSGMAELFVN